MNNKKIANKFLQSYLYTEFGSFFISTAYRQSSALVQDPPWYYETLAWNEKKEMVADNSGAFAAEQAYMQHIEVIKQLNATGVFQDFF